MMSETVFILLLVLSAHEYRAHDARQSFYAQTKPPLLECDMEIRLGLNESYAFNFFPPEQRGFNYGYEHGNDYIPHECTLHFKARDNCVLKFRTGYYTRGDIDCNEQYLLIGDENREEMVCGFGRPPRSLNSTGRELFLTYYQRNGRHTKGMTQPSKIRGHVHCEKGVPSVPPVNCSPPTQSFIAGTSFFCANGPCTLTLASNGTKIADCEASPTQNCTMTIAVWHATVLLNQTCGGSLLPPIPTAEPNCVTVDNPCPPANPNCDNLPSPKYNFGTRNTLDSFPCGVIGELCTRRYLFCFTIG